MKEFLDKLPYTTLILTYIFLCASLYNISFWGTFDIDPSNLLTLADIPKSFLYPSVYAIAVGFVGGMYPALIEFFDEDNHSKEATVETEVQSIDEPVSEPEQTESEQKKSKWARLSTKQKWGIFIAPIGFIGTFLLMVFWEKIEDHMILFVFAYASVFGFAVSSLSRNQLLRKLIPNQFARKGILIFVLIMPGASFFAGGMRSQDISESKNPNIVYIIGSRDTTISSLLRTDTLKLVGFLGDQLVVSTVSNEKIIMVNKSSYERLELIKYQKLKGKKISPIKVVKDAAKIDTVNH